MKVAKSKYRLLQSVAVPAALSVFLISPFAVGQDQSPDNSGRNKVETTTADRQSEASTDRLLTQRIRKAIIADKSLSTYGHNIKIITKDGAVTLTGPVHSDDEKQNIGAKAADAAGGADKVMNQLTVKQ
jgi:hyperosmotically inducible protein